MNAPAAEAKAAGRFLFVDALRGIAALAVVLFHGRAGGHIDALAAALPAAVVAVLDHGNLGVQVFFVLSGFVIAQSMVRHDVTPGYVARFLLRRSIRLDPPYWASMAIVVAVGLLSVRFVPGKVYEAPSFGAVLAHVGYVQDFLRVHPINDIYWTLCLEIQFYLSFVVLLGVVTALRPRLGANAAFLVVLVPATVLADLYPLGLGPWHVHGLFLGHWHLFLAGVWVWWGVHNPGVLSRVLVGCNLALLTGAVLWQRDVALGVGVVAAVAILAAGWLGTLRTWLAARPWQFLGAISYSLYLVHNPITGPVFRIGSQLTGPGIASEALWFAGAVAGSIAGAWLLWRVVEKPSLALSHRIRLVPTQRA